MTDHTHTHCGGSRQPGVEVVGRRVTGAGRYPGRGKCPVCFRDFKLTLDGLVRVHRARTVATGEGCPDA